LAGGFAGLAMQAVGMGCSQPTPNLKSRSGYDLCVIGSGFAGVHLALRAAAAGLQTIVIEPGSELANSFGYLNSGDVRYPVAAARAIAVGGTSTHWTGVVSRMWPRNFALRSTFGHFVDWPITYKDLEPYYCESEELLSVLGRKPVVGAEPPRICDYPQLDENQRTEGLSIRGEELDFFFKAVSRRGDGPVRLANIEIPSLVESSHGSLMQDHRVTNIVTLDGQSIDHVVARAKDGTKSIVSAKYFVVAAGVIESPRLLLMSQSQWFPRGIGNNYGQVGRHFLHHPHLYSEFRPKRHADRHQHDHGANAQFRFSDVGTRTQRL